MIKANQRWNELQYGMLCWYQDHFQSMSVIRFCSGLNIVSVSAL